MKRRALVMDEPFPPGSYLRDDLEGGEATMRKPILTLLFVLVIGFGAGWFARGESEFVSGSHVGFQQAMHYCENTRDMRCKLKR
jgi:hypothetical protein